MLKNTRSRFSFFPVLFVVFCLFMSMTAAANAGDTGIMRLQSMTGSDGFVRSVSADGSVITGYTLSNGRRTPFRWSETSGVITLGWLQPSGNGNAEGKSVSDNGIHIVGTESYPAQPFDDPSSVGFRWSPGNNMMALSSSGPGFRRSANAVADTGRAVGFVPSSLFSESSQAAIWNGNQVTLLGLMVPEDTFSWTVANAVTPDGNIVAGSGIGFSNGSYGPRAFRWTQATGMVPLGLAVGQSSNNGTDISADGNVIVGNATRSGARTIFRWTMETGVVDLGRLPGTSFCDGIRTSGDGSIIVGNCDSVPFIWTQHLGLQPLNSALVNHYEVDLTGWYLGQVADVSSDGQFLVGTGAYNSSLDGWRIQIPEPGVCTLVLAGLLLAALRGRAGRFV
jgi:uncharacterized membrane protein